MLVITIVNYIVSAIGWKSKLFRQKWMKFMVFRSFFTVILLITSPLIFTYHQRMISKLDFLHHTMYEFSKNTQIRVSSFFFSYSDRFQPYVVWDVKEIIFKNFLCTCIPHRRLFVGHKVRAVDLNRTGRLWPTQYFQILLNEKCKR